MNDPVWPVPVRKRIAEDYGYPANDVARLKALGLMRAEEIAASAPAESLDEEYAVKMKTRIKPVQTMIVSPLVESQTLDLADSTRLQTQLALSLAAAVNYPGATASVKALEQFAKSRQYDAATRTPLSMVNSEGGQDGSFGFQIGPRFQALSNPANGSSGAGSVLDRQSFPAVFICGMSKGDIEPRLNTNSDGRFMVYEPYLALHQTRRWVPLKLSWFTWREWYNAKNWFQFHPLRESERMKTADDLESAAPVLQVLRWASRSEFNGDSYLTNSLRDRLEFYERQLIGTINYVTLAPDRLVPDVATLTPEVTNVIPSQVNLHLTPVGEFDPTPMTFVLQGNNLDNVAGPFTTLFTNASSIVALARSRSSITIQAVVTNADWPLVFQLPSTVSPTALPILSRPLPVQTPNTLPQVLDVEPKLVVLKAATNGAPAPTNLDIVFVGSGLTRIDTVNVRVATGAAQLTGALQALGDGLKANVNITNTGAICFLLPIKPTPGTTLTNFIVSRPVQVDVGPTPTNLPAKQTTNAPTVTYLKFGPVSGATVDFSTNASPEAIAAAAKIVAAALSGHKEALAVPAKVIVNSTNVTAH
jgi:hypothetical protein